MRGGTMNGLKFYPASHRYKLDGEWVPGVTSILGVINKPALTKWAATSVAEFVADNPDTVQNLYDMGRQPMVSALKETPWQKSKDAATRGNVLHDYAEDLLNGKEIDVAAEHVDVMEHALRFMDDWNIKPVLVEQACASREHWWAGTFDLVADHNRGPRAIFDWKSGKRIYAAAAFQMNFYGHAEFYGLDGDEHPMADLGIEAAYGVHIRQDGYDVLPLPYGPDIYAECLAIRQVFDINKRAEGDWKQPGSGYVGLPLPAEAVAS